MAFAAATAACVRAAIRRPASIMRVVDVSRWRITTCGNPWASQSRPFGVDGSGTGGGTAGRGAALMMTRGVTE